MKSFQQFIIEARQTLASQQATQMGLRPNGHGDYYDQQGKLVAKTVGGQLKVFKGRQSKPQAGNGAKQAPPPETQQTVTQEPAEPQSQEQPTQGQDDNKGIVVVVGRFNPPAKNHEQLLKFGLARSKENGYDFRIYPSRVQDKATNPLNPTLKIQYMQVMYPDFSDYILDSDDMKTIFDILGSVYNDGYKDIKIIVGSDRVGEFQSLVHKNEGQGYEFDNIEVIPASIRDPDSDSAGTGSSVALRTAAAEKNYEKFASNLPSRMKREDKESLFASVMKTMKLKENYELWKIAPELNKDELRKHYKENDLYPVGCLVENINTGLRGRVIRRGTNYLICLTNEGTVFKSWLSSIHLPEDVYEVGTDKYRKFLQDMTPGQPTKTFTGIKIKETVPKNINSLRKELLNKK